MIILFNKPYGVISQFSPHPKLKTLKEFIPLLNIYPVGRLDADSEGLLILTDNGKLQNELANPTKKVFKKYWVQVENIPKESDLKELETGIKIKDYLTKPAKLRFIEDPKIWHREKPIRERKKIPTSWLEIQICEGKNRQIRKMTAAINCPTLRLIRVAIGNYSIEGINPGQYMNFADHDLIT